MLKIKSANKQTGVSLIEILVTCLVIGIGLLGVAILQVSSVSSNQEAYFYSQATFIAEDLSSRIRASKVVTTLGDDNTRGRPKVSLDAFLGNYANNTSVTAVPIVCSSEPVECGVNRPNGEGGQTALSSSQSCTLSEIASFDLGQACWSAKNLLPEGLVRVKRVLNRLRIIVEWSPLAARRDVGHKEANINTNCSNLINDTGNNCIILELVP